MTELAPTAMARFVQKTMRCLMTKKLLLQFSWSGGSRINCFGELQKRENFKGQRYIVKVIQSKKTNALVESQNCACRFNLLFFLRLNVVLNATYFSYNEKKIVCAGDIDLKIRRVLQNMQSKHFSRRKEQRVEVIEAQHDSTDDAMDTTLVQATLDV